VMLSCLFYCCLSR